jgi:hypothetical protein
MTNKEPRTTKVCTLDRYKNLYNKVCTLDKLLQQKNKNFDHKGLEKNKYWYTKDVHRIKA